MEKWAKFSPCRKYRYLLVRIWSGAPPLGVVGLNPSTADETTDDPTIRRCIGFAERWGFGGLLMVNLYAFRATDPRELWASPLDPVGPKTDTYIASLVARTMLCAWGAHAHEHGARRREVVKLLGDRELLCLGLTKAGEPRHPLYVKGDSKPQPFRRRV